MASVSNLPENEAEMSSKYATPAAPVDVSSTVNTIFSLTCVVSMPSSGKLISLCTQYQAGDEGKGWARQVTLLVVLFASTTKRQTIGVTIGDPTCLIRALQVCFVFCFIIIIIIIILTRWRSEEV